MSTDQLLAEVGPAWSVRDLIVMAPGSAGKVSWSWPDWQDRDAPGRPPPRPIVVETLGGPRVQRWDFVRPCGVVYSWPGHGRHRSG